MTTARTQVPYRLHGRNHGLRRSDPGDIGVDSASLMGQVVGAAHLTNGLALHGGVLFLPERDGPPLLSGETINVSYSHFEPVNHFAYLAARAHIVTGLTVDAYNYVHPWESNPWNGGVGGPAISDPYPTFGGWHGFVTFAAVTNDDGETATWTLPDAGSTPEQYAFDPTGIGHIGYLLHDFGSSRVVGNVTIAYSGASTEQTGAILWNLSPGAVTVGDMVGEYIFDELGGSGVTNNISITLTEDVPAGSQLLIVSAAVGPTGFAPPDAGNRPQIRIRIPTGTLVAKYRVGRQLYMLPEPAIVGMVSEDIDGGSP